MSETGLKNENRLVKKKPPLATTYHGKCDIDKSLDKKQKKKKKRRTREVISNVHGEDDINVEAFVVTVGGMRLHKR